MLRAAFFRPVRKSFKRILRFTALTILFLPLYALPRGLARGVGAAYGTIAWWSLPRLRRRSVENLARAFPEWSAERRRRVAQGVTRWVGRTGADFLRMGRGDRIHLLRAVVPEGLEHWEAAVAIGKGIVAVTGHFGNWELLGAWLAARGHSVHVLYHPFDEERINRLVGSVRSRAGVRGIAADRAGVRALRALRRGGVVGVLVDRVPRGPAVECRFFGRPCRTAPGAAWLARYSGAPVVPVALWDAGGGRYRLRVGSPLPSPVPGEREGQERDKHERNAQDRDEQWVCDLTRRLTGLVEAQIREAPEQWPWFYDRWKLRGDLLRPGGAATERGETAEPGAGIGGRGPV